MLQAFPGRFFFKIYNSKNSIRDSRMLRRDMCINISIIDGNKYQVSPHAICNMCEYMQQIITVYFEVRLCGGFCMADENFSVQVFSGACYPHFTTRTCCTDWDISQKDADTNQRTGNPILIPGYGSVRTNCGKLDAVEGNRHLL